MLRRPTRSKNEAVVPEEEFIPSTYVRQPTYLLHSLSTLNCKLPACLRPVYRRHFWAESSSSAPELGLQLVDWRHSGALFRCQCSEPARGSSWTQSGWSVPVAQCPDSLATTARPPNTAVGLLNPIHPLCTPPSLSITAYHLDLDGFYCLEKGNI